MREPNWTIYGYYLIIAIFFAVYFPALKGGFDLIDDVTLIEKAVYFTTWESFYYEEQGRIISHRILLWIYHKLWGLNPVGYYLGNFFIHLGSAFLLGFIVRDLTKSGIISFLTSLIFSVHFLHFESLGDISCITEISCTFFYLAALFAYLKENLGWGSLFFILAIFSKQTAIHFPMILIILLLFKKKLLIGRCLTPRFDWEKKDNNWKLFLLSLGVPFIIYAFHSLPWLFRWRNAFTQDAIYEKSRFIEIMRPFSLDIFGYFLGDFSLGSKLLFAFWFICALPLLVRPKTYISLLLPLMLYAFSIVPLIVIFPIRLYARFFYMPLLWSSWIQAMIFVWYMDKIKGKSKNIALFFLIISLAILHGLSFRTIKKVEPSVMMLSAIVSHIKEEYPEIVNRDVETHIFAEELRHLGTDDIITECSLEMGLKLMLNNQKIKVNCDFPLIVPHYSFDLDLSLMGLSEYIKEKPK